jgi:hypothetical protein
MFQIVRIPANAPEATEPLGTKDKFWYGDHLFLFKKARPGTGEDWAEKIAEQVAAFLTLPHATYEMADWETDSGVERGVVSRNFCERGAALVLGNELLADADPDYAVGAISKFHVPAHTVERVVYTLRQRRPGLPLDWAPPPFVEDACDAFIGYLLLDAIVGNTDRHHENWGFIRSVGGQFHLAPTFDHASSLGRNLRDADRARRLWTRDRNSDVAAFGKRARSALFKHEADARAFANVGGFCRGGTALAAGGPGVA